MTFEQSETAKVVKMTTALHKLADAYAEEGKLADAATLRRFATSTPSDSLLRLHGILTSIDVPMPAAVASIEVGDKVRMLEETTGDDDESVEHTFPIGAKGVVTSIAYIGGSQGWGVTIVIEDTIVNVFDEGDSIEALFPFVKEA